MSHQSFRIFNETGASPVVIACEHASHHIPACYRGLGLSDKDLRSHIAWDPGAAAVAQLLSNRLDASLVIQRYSRLLYDCNRPPDAKSAIPVLSELTSIPANIDLDDEERSSRVSKIYQPFHDAVTQQIRTRQRNNIEPVLITIHSFTREFKSVQRVLELGIISDSDTSLSDAIIRNIDRSCGRVLANEPYSVTDGVTHTLQLHGTGNKIKNSMIEICNDQIENAESQHQWADYLGNAIESALLSLRGSESTRLDRSSSNQAH